MRHQASPALVILVLTLLLSACDGGQEAPAEIPDRTARVVVDKAGMDDQKAAEAPEESDRAKGEEGRMGDPAAQAAPSTPEAVAPAEAEKKTLNEALGDMSGLQAPVLGAEGGGQALGSGGLGMKGTGVGGGGGNIGSLGGLGTSGKGKGGGGLGGAPGRLNGRARVDTGGGRMGAVRRPAPTPAPNLDPAARPEPNANAEEYKNHGVNPFVDPARDKLSTFSIDVDTGAYTIARRKLQEGSLPPAASVRVEEFVNFFKYAYPQPDGQVPFAVAFEAAPSPFAADTLMLRVGVQGKALTAAERKPAHLVFLVDTSGSMSAPDKLGLAQKSMFMLVNQLQEGDTVGICTYAGSVTEVLQPTGMEHRARIHEAIENMRSGGSTAMADGLENAYKMAYKTLKPGHVNRIIVLSDGDANVGQSSHEEILKRIGHYTQEGVTLSTIGFGMGNYKDTMMEQLANKGNGNYYYIDSWKQARRVFTEQLGGTLQVIAKDVKIQVEFDPALVAGYRLVGYENRDIADKDFRNDAVDAGEIGAGHSVTALYELKLKPGAQGDPAIVRIRHKAPEGARASENEYRFGQQNVRASFEEASDDFRLAVMVAAFAEKLRKSPHASSWQWSRIRDLTAKAAEKNEDEQELLALIDKARTLSGD